MPNEWTELLIVTDSDNDYPVRYLARTEGDIEGAVISAIKDLRLAANDATIKDMVHDLKMYHLYWFDDYAFMVYNL